MRQNVILVATALCVASTFVAGRSSAAQLAGVGFKGGLSISTLHGRLPTDGFVENGTRLGAGGGAAFAIGLGRNFSLQVEALYAAKGTSLGKVTLTDETGVQIGTADVIEALDYLEFPVLARWTFAPAGQVSPFLLAGPAVSVRLSQELRTTGDVSTAIDLDVARGADMGLALGAGLELGGGRVRWSAETRYTLGLTPATRDTYSDSARNGDLLILAGIFIRQ